MNELLARDDPSSPKDVTPSYILSSIPDETFSSFLV